MNNHETPKGWDVVYDPEKRCFMFQNRRSGLRQKTKPQPDTYYQEYNPEHNTHRVYQTPEPTSYQASNSLAKDKIHTLTEPLHEKLHEFSDRHANQRAYHSKDHKHSHQPPGPSSVRRQKTTPWEDLWQQRGRGQHHVPRPNHYSTRMHPDDSCSNFDGASLYSEAESFASVTTVAHGEARFEPAWYDLYGLQRGCQMANNAPMGNQDAYRLVFEMSVELLLIMTRYGYIIKLNKPSHNYTKSVKMEAVSILKINWNPDPYQPDLLLNVSNGTHIVYELRHYVGRGAPNYQLKCYIREPGRGGRPIVVLERRWDVLTKHPVTVTLTTETFAQDGVHSAATDPRYMEIHRSKIDRTKGVSYEAVEFVPPRTAATVTKTRSPNIREMSVKQGVNVPLLALIIAGADMMWQ